MVVVRLYWMTVERGTDTIVERLTRLKYIRQGRVVVNGMGIEKEGGKALDLV